MAGRLTRKYLVRGSAPRSRSQSSQTSGASRRSRHSWAGVTRTAQKRARHGGFVPLRHVMRRHCGGSLRRGPHARLDGQRVGRQLRARARPAGRAAGAAGALQHGCAEKHLHIGRDAQRIRQLRAMQRAPQRGVVAELGVGDDRRDRQPLARTCRSSVSARRHFSWKRTVGGNPGAPRADRA